MEEFLTALQQGEISQFIEGQIGRKLTEREKLAVAQSKYNITLTRPALHVILANGKILDADILQYSGPIRQHGKDVAVLKIPGANLPTVALGNSDNVRLQDQIMVLGYPGLASPWGGNPLISSESSLEPTATNGHISALKTGILGTPLLQSDAAITHGNSGGPAFNERSQVIGIGTFVSLEKGVQIQGFNFLVPINIAMEFVRQAGVSPEVGSFNTHWARALDLYNDGQCDRATAEFDNVSQFMAGLPDAQRYRAAAVKCWDDMGPVEKVTKTIGMGPVYGLVAIMILGAVALLAFRRSSLAPAMAKAAGAGIGVADARGALHRGQALSLHEARSDYGRIQFISGPLSGRTFKIEKEGLWIGRDSSKCGVVLADDAVSSQHVWIVPIDGDVAVIDKNSSNGTYVNSVDSPRISKVGLRNGDRIYLGKTGKTVFTYFAA